MGVMMLLCVFFIFKQKTAYEMRISDWSSDVCSSDLRIAMREATELRDDRPMPLGKFKRLLPGQVLFQSGEQQHAEFLVGEILAVLERHVEELQIGRASCRERVCQYV